ncbi:MAG: molybdopterin-dependent oxidoreductase [Pseudomonadales bacterium]|nr:molybdopterin-dependent oxidoreductase [Pseudomonadales bacterium]
MIDRRKFLKFSTVAATAPVLYTAKGKAQERIFKKGGIGYVRLTGMEKESVPTACAMCASRCAAVAYLDRDYVVKMEGQLNSIRNEGKMCAKGQAGYLQAYDPDRLLKPMRRTGARGEGKWEQISWEDALEELTDRLRALREKGEPEKFMFHHGWISASAKALITEVFLPSYGTATIADNSCLGQSARALGRELTWGGKEDNWDFGNTRYILNFGSNVMEAHTNHVALSRRLSQALVDRHAKMVTFDVRLSNTASKSHTWYQIRPGTDSAVALAMCNVLVSENLLPREGEEFLKYCLVTEDRNASTEQKKAALRKHLAGYTPEWAEDISGVPAAEIRKVAREFSLAKPGCVISSRGASAHYAGVDTERAIQMLAALTGNIDNPGGRCLAVRPDWKYPQGPESKPHPRKLNVLEGFDGNIALPVHGVGHQVLRMIREGSAGRPDVYLWYNYNPVFSNGNCQENIDILKDESLIPFTVAVTPFYDESAALADLILPDVTYLEKFDFEAGVAPDQVAEYYIRQPVIPSQGESRDFMDVCCDLADRLGFPLGFASAEEFVEEACKMTPEVKAAGGFRKLKKEGVWHDESAEPLYYSYKLPVTRIEINAKGVIFDEDTGVYWNWMASGAKGEAEARAKGYTGTPGAFKGYVAQQFGDSVTRGFVPAYVNKSGYFELYSKILADKGLPPLPTYKPIPEHQDLEQDQLILTTFRVNVQTLSRTQNCKWLDEINNESPAWINTKTAEERGIRDGDAIKIRTALGEVETIAKVTENVVSGVVAISSHGGRWEYGRYASGKKAPYGLDEDETYELEALKWWEHETIHPNWIIENVAEPISGQQRWMDTVVSVSKA